MKNILLIIIFLLFSSCAKRSKTFVHNGIEISEDYILVEFASKLEEDYHRLQANDNKLDEQHDHSDSH